MLRVVSVLLALSLLVNIYFFFPIFLEKVVKVPARAKASYGLVFRDLKFLNATIGIFDAMEMGPLCTAHAGSDTGLLRFLFADGQIFNFDGNEEFLAELGNPVAFHEYESDDPEADANDVARRFRSAGYPVKVIDHYDPEMKGKMFFISFADLRRRPGWCLAFRLPGRKLSKTKPWEGGS